MSANEKAISKDTLDIYLKELGKQEWGLTEKVDDTDESEELDLTDLTLSYGGRS